MLTSPNILALSTDRGGEIVVQHSLGGEGPRASERTRGHLRSFGASVTAYEEEMLRLIESARSGGDPREILERALSLTLSINRRAVEMLSYLSSLEAELLEELLKGLGEGGTGRGGR